MRDEDLAAARADLGRLSLATAGALNAQQALGVDANGAAGQPLLSVAAPTTRAHAANTTATALQATVSDASQLAASDYRVSWDGGQWQITRLSDQQTTLAATLPATLDGLTLQASGAPAAGESFLVQPYARAATSIAARALSPSQLATGYAATPQAALGNAGSARVAGFEMARASADNTLAVSITFNDPPTSFNITGLAGGPLSNVPYAPGQSIPSAPADYNGWRLTLDGAAAAGDRFDVQRNTAPGADNRNALALGKVAHKGLVDGGTLNQGYASLIAQVGGRIQSGQNLADVSGRMETEARARKEAVSGVNLDEEAANLLRFQQAYQACARIIQASQALFESLLSATGR